MSIARKPPCLVLAGGRSRRMGGGDKCLLALDSRPMLAHVLERLSGQVTATLINSNSEPELFRGFGAPVLPDVIAGFQGPLAGLLTGMLWARRHHPDTPYLLSVSCDTPFLPLDLAVRLSESLSGANADIAIARDADRVHPTLGLWPVDLAERLARDIQERGVRSVQLWLRDLRVCETLFTARQLQNINTPDDLQNAEMQLQDTLSLAG
jgi:molybdenum cofactor guanylyltransferase